MCAKDWSVCVMHPAHLDCWFLQRAIQGTETKHREKNIAVLALLCWLFMGYPFQDVPYDSTWLDQTLSYSNILHHPSLRMPDPGVALSEMWYWVFLWCLFSSLFVHGVVGLLMFVMLQRHKRGRLITLVLVSVGFLASLSGGVITSAAVAGVYRVAGKGMAPLEALILGVGQTSLSVIISFSRILATL
ncbi:transmembrane protein 170B isoform X1 [Dunckerocampus dactyliophorus]|uniref:transmembrane protein 170B isoform X1 n=1 Tax=Dunckerocampus dactyliophorus TaxID=161453 RepID=UPI002404A9D5|nr:transmembrane protein 170B isoform X1 [Dunckerocampus dactyliophorus]